MFSAVSFALSDQPERIAVTGDAPDVQAIAAKSIIHSRDLSQVEFMRIFDPYAFECMLMQPGLIRQCLRPVKIVGIVQMAVIIKFKSLHPAFFKIIELCRKSHIHLWQTGFPGDDHHRKITHPFGTVCSLPGPAVHQQIKG